MRPLEGAWSKKTNLIKTALVSTWLVLFLNREINNLPRRREKNFITSVSLFIERSLRKTKNGFLKTDETQKLCFTITNFQTTHKRAFKGL